jgi:hypothetical protein
MSMTPSMLTRMKGQRGSVLIQVAVAMLALLAICSFVFDYGVMWVSRGQAQTAADAGALSGAISLAWGSPTDFAGARLRAITMARQNAVWGAVPSVTDADVTFPACPPGAPGLPDTCVKVDVFRNQARGRSIVRNQPDEMGFPDAPIFTANRAPMSRGRLKPVPGPEALGGM